MNRKLISSILVLTAYFSFSMVASAGTIEEIRRNGVLNICASDASLPFSADHPTTPGVHLELAEMLATKLGVKLQISWVLFRYQAKYTGCDAFMGAAVLGESEGFIKTTTPYMDIKTLAVTKPGKQLTTLDDLNGLRIAMPAGSVGHMALVDRPVEIFVSYIREGDILNAVRAGKVDVGLVTNTGLGWYLKNHPESDLESHPTQFIHEMNGYPMAIGFRKSNAATADIASQILDELKAQDALRNLFARYGLSEALR